MALDKLLAAGHVVSVCGGGLFQLPMKQKSRLLILRMSTSGQYFGTPVIIYSACCEKNSLEASRVQNGEGFLLPLVTNRKTPAHEIWGSFKVHVHFTCIFLSFLGLPAVWSVSVSGCFYFHCPVAVLSKVVELAGVEPASEISTSSVLHA